MSNEMMLVLGDLQNRCCEFIDELDDMINVLIDIRSKSDAVTADAYDLQDEIDNSAMIISSILSKEEIKK